MGPIKNASPDEDPALADRIAPEWRLRRTATLERGTPLVTLVVESRGPQFGFHELGSDDFAATIASRRASR